MILVGASIFAVSAFGVNQCAILIHKAGTAGLLRNIADNWNQSLTETGKELNDADEAFITFVDPHWRNRHIQHFGMSDGSR